MRQYLRELRALKKDQELDQTRSYPCIIKKIPLYKQKNCLAPCYLEIEKLEKNKQKKTPSLNLYKGIPIGLIRSMMGSDNLDITKELIEESIIKMPLSDHIIDLYMYRPLHCLDSLPCVMYFHGGAYVGGSVQTAHHICKAICEQMHAVVISVDYRLAPETPYPGGVDDCYAALKWIRKNADAYYVNTDELYVAGDSAGGNMALNCCIKDYEQDEMCTIKGTILFYPHVMIEETKEYPWSKEYYTMSAKDKLRIMKDMLALQNIIKSLDLVYLQRKAANNDPHVSPLLYPDVSIFPKTIIFTAEYDYLRIQQEYFAKRLHDAGGDVRVIQYQGMQHAFMDRIGYFAQSEDAVYEAVSFFR